MTWLNLVADTTFGTTKIFAVEDDPRMTISFKTLSLTETSRWGIIFRRK